MADYGKYEQMRDAGATSYEVYVALKSDGYDEIASIKALRVVFDLSLVEAKTVTVSSSDDLSDTRDKHLSDLVSALENTLVITAEYIIRLATTDDIPTVVRHRWAMFKDMNLTAFLETPNVGEAFAEWVRPRIVNGEYIGFLVVDDNSEVVAGAGVWLIEWIPQVPDLSTRRAYLMNVFVDEAHRRQGLARLLVTTALDWCREQGIHHVTLHASDKGRPLYESLGFAVTNEMRVLLL